MIGFPVHIGRHVVWLSVQEVFAAVEVKCEIQEVCCAQVGLFCYFKSEISEMLHKVFLGAFCCAARDVFVNGLGHRPCTIRYCSSHTTLGGWQGRRCRLIRKPLRCRNYPLLRRISRFRPVFVF